MQRLSGGTNPFVKSPQISSVQRRLPDCRLKQLNLREFARCENLAHYRVAVELSNGRAIRMDLCSEHMRNALRIAEIEAARTYPGEDVKVTSMRFHHLALADRAKAS